MLDSDDDRRLLEAVSLAARAHRGQERKDGRTPYVSHPFRVCLIVHHRFGFADARMLMTALLHDTIEDTTTDYDDLVEKFGRDVARWVADLTKDKRLPEAERERAYMDRLRSAPWQVQVCKLADVYDNLLDSHTMPAERRDHSVRRASEYVEALAPGATAEIAEPLRLVRKLLAELGHAGA